jgi:predicted DNA-binding transcriptional regulator AlpA
VAKTSPHGAASTLSPQLIEENAKAQAEAALASVSVPVPVRGVHAPPERKHVTAARQAVAAQLPALRHLQLLMKHEVVAVTGVTYPTIWAWMRAGTFPRSREVGGKSAWLASEVEAWLANLPLRKLKGDEAA